MKKGVREEADIITTAKWDQEPKGDTTPAVRAIPENLCPNDKIHTGSGLEERRKKSREMKKEEGVGRKGRKKSREMKKEEEGVGRKGRKKSREMKKEEEGVGRKGRKGRKK